MTYQPTSISTFNTKIPISNITQLNKMYVGDRICNNSSSDLVILTITAKPGDVIESITETQGKFVTNVLPIPTPGPAGKSAYEAAKEGGYQGTEAEFNQILASFDLSGKANTNLNNVVSGSVTSGLIASGAVGTSQIAANAITYDKVNTNWLRRGSLATPFAAGTSSVTVSFGATMIGAPYVFTNNHTTLPAQRALGVTGVTTTGFTLNKQNLTSASSSNVTVSYMAIYR